MLETLYLVSFNLWPGVLAALPAFLLKLSCGGSLFDHGNPPSFYFKFDVPGRFQHFENVGQVLRP